MVIRYLQGSNFPLNNLDSKKGLFSVHSLVWNSNTFLKWKFSEMSSVCGDGTRQPWLNKQRVLSIFIFYWPYCQFRKPIWAAVSWSKMSKVTQSCFVFLYMVFGTKIKPKRFRGINFWRIFCDQITFSSVCLIKSVEPKDDFDRNFWDFYYNFLATLNIFIWLAKNLERLLSIE